MSSLLAPKCNISGLEKGRNLMLYIPSMFLRGALGILVGLCVAQVLVAQERSKELPRPGTQRDTVRSAQQQPGPLSRRARAVLRREGKSPEVEAVAVVIDTVGVLEAIRALPRDSSARIANFHHVRHDPPSVPLGVHRQHPMYADYSSRIRFTNVLDSVQLRYRVEWKMSGGAVRIPVEMSFDEYREYRERQAVRKNWEALAQAYQLEEEKKKGLSELFGQVTNIEIPVPKNPLFSIFGPNIIKLQINGAVDIHAAFRNTKSDLITASPLGQNRNEPDFNQEVQVNVKGEIGDKLTINADWNTQRTFEYENQMRVKYTGYEDEIIQSVEAGNVSLQTNSSFIASNQALFGIKAGMQFGPLRLTTIASQKKGQIKELSVSGGARATPFERRPHEYSRDHFFIDLAYRSRYETAYKTIPLTVVDSLVIQDIEVWVTRIGADDPNERDVVAFIRRDTVQWYQVRSRTGEFSVQQGEVEVGRFVRLEEGKDFTYDKYLGFLSLSRTVQAEQAIAVAYTLPSGDIGNFGSKDTVKDAKLALKLVKPRQLGPQMQHAWSLMMKNIYPLGGRNIKKEGFRFELFYQAPGRPQPGDKTIFGLNVIEMVGLDRYNNIPSPVPDGDFDYLPPYTVNEARGEVIFPVLEPFGRSLRDYFTRILEDTARGRTFADSIAVYAVYDTTYNGAANNPKNLFVMKGEITAAIASAYNLGFNVVEGSVSVVANGVTGTPNVDYTVDYITGQVIVKNLSYLVPGSDLQIRYEQNDLFQLASKSLLGARGEMNLGKQAALGFTVMNLNQQTLSDKVRLGEEPISNTILGVDAGLNFDMDFLTRALNMLPGVQTTAPSSFTLRGEAAYMLPDPNTRKSTIPQDQSKGIAYLDDFEGARRIIPLGHTYSQWAPASVPFYISTIDPYAVVNRKIPTNVDTSLIFLDTKKIEYKSALSWFNVLPSDVLVKDIWPNRSVSQEQQQVTVLDVYFDPKKRSAFNYSLDLDTKLFANSQRAWSGVMRPLGTTATNLLDENINFIELWIFFERTQSTAKLNIDLGIISEDVIPSIPRRLDTEDGLKTGFRNGVLNEGEDVGLDGLTDDEERARFASFVSRFPQFANDPSGDNWLRAPLGSLDPGDYVGFNGSEGNAELDVGKIPDTEDLNRNNNLDRSNSYFEYEIPLNLDSLKNRGWLADISLEALRRDWQQIRIPINEFTRQIGDPTLTTIESVRWWITGAQDVVHFRLTELNLVGNQWEEQIKNDTTLRVTVVNIEDNPSYTSPPGVRRERNRARPDQELFGNEQSLALIINNLQDGDSRQVFKRYQSRPLDIFSYRALKMFVHGDDRPETYIDSTKYKAELFLRFGSDTLNFYEYRAPIRPGWHSANEVVINFGDLTAIKLGRDSATAVGEPVPVPNGPEGATYRVRGQPTLTNIRFIAVGIHNPEQKEWNPGGKLNGEVWINELRLTDVDDTPGWAYRFDTGLKLADIATVSFNLTQRDPFFHSLEDRFGSRNTDRNWSVAVGVGFEKFLPTSWSGTTLGFNYSHVEGMQRPRYLPGTDILVEEAATRTASVAENRGSSASDAERIADAVREESKTVSVSETYTLPGIKFNIPSSFWLVKETINRMNFSFSYNTTRRRNPTTESFHDWGWNARFGYGLQFGQDNFLQPLSFASSVPGLSGLKNWKIYYAPRSVNFATTLNRRQTREQQRNQTTQRPVVRNLNATRQFAFGWQLTEGGLLNLGTDYSLDVQSNLVHFEVDRFGRQRSFTDILGDIFAGQKLVDFGIDQNYGQTIAINSRPTVPSVLKLDKIFFPSARYNVRYDWANNLQAGALGKGAQWNGNLTLSLDIGVRAIGDELWGRSPIPPQDTTTSKVTKQLDQITRVLLKTPFFDFDRIAITFSQNNRSQNSGLVGRPGFVNMFGRVPFVQESLPEYGPSFLYQLGLSSDPHGDVVVKSKRQFPFITGYTVPGIRAPFGNLTDIYNQSNKVTMRTSRPLWEGAQLELSWNIGWSYNLNRTIVTNSLGVPEERSRVVSGDADRSFLSFPSTFVFNFFKTSVAEVNKKYEVMKLDRRDSRTNDAKLSQAFEEGMEAFPFTRKLFGTLFPRMNWTIRWDGLEKFDLFKSFAQRVGIDHAYSSNYRRRYKLTPSGQELTESQQVSYSFSPLVGVNVTFKEIFKGNFGATFRYNTTSSFDLVPANQNVTESNNDDISVSANFSRRGFEIPFFGLSLSNDLDISFTYGFSKNARKLFTLKENFKPAGTPQDGSSRTIMEPRIRYILSSRVTASLYYKYTKVTPDAGGSKIPGSTINEGGLDIRVAIQ